MVGSDWINNGSEGRGLKRAFKRLLAKMDQTQDINELTAITRSLAYVATAKVNIVKMEKDKELEERIKKLEEAAGLAQQSPPISK